MLPPANHRSRLRVSGSRLRRYARMPSTPPITSVAATTAVWPAYTRSNQRRPLGANAAAAAIHTSISAKGSGVGHREHGSSAAGGPIVPR